MNINYRIKKVRLRLGADKKIVQERLKCNRTDLALWEKKKAIPFYRFVEICCLYGISMNDMIGSGQLCPRLTGYENLGRQKTDIIGGMGERIKKIRVDAGVSILHLATEINVSSLTIVKWESELAYPNIRRCIILSEALGTKIDNFVPLLDRFVS
jgi:transcriptional regulator with XRE-family HTH domain